MSKLEFQAGSNSKGTTGKSNWSFYLAKFCRKPKLNLVVISLIIQVRLLFSDIIEDELYNVLLFYGGITGCQSFIL